MHILGMHILGMHFARGGPGSEGGSGRETHMHVPAPLAQHHLTSSNSRTQDYEFYYTRG